MSSPYDTESGERRREKTIMGSLFGAEVLWGAMIACEVVYSSGTCSQW